MKFSSRLVYAKKLTQQQEFTVLLQTVEHRIGTVYSTITGKAMAMSQKGFPKRIMRLSQPAI